MTLLDKLLFALISEAFVVTEEQYPTKAADVSGTTKEQIVASATATKLLNGHIISILLEYCVVGDQTYVNLHVDMTEQMYRAAFDNESNETVVLRCEDESVVRKIKQWAAFQEQLPPTELPYHEEVDWAAWRREKEYAEKLEEASDHWTPAGVDREERLQHAMRVADRVTRELRRRAGLP
jgi:hypothetical protein